MIEPPPSGQCHHERQPEQVADGEAETHEDTLKRVGIAVPAQPLAPLLLILAVAATYEYQEQDDGRKRQSDDAKCDGSRGTGG